MNSNSDESARVFPIIVGLALLAAIGVFFALTATATEQETPSVLTQPTPEPIDAPVPTPPTVGPTVIEPMPVIPAFGRIRFGFAPYRYTMKYEHPQVVLARRRGCCPVVVPAPVVTKPAVAVNVCPTYRVRVRGRCPVCPVGVTPVPTCSKCPSE